jgi:signal transduction histidine kinase
MSDLPGDSFLLSTNQVLVRRTRVILLICLVGGLIYSSLQLSRWQPDVWPSFSIHLLGLAASTSGLLILRLPWAVRHAWLAAAASISGAYALTALARALDPTGEYATTAIMFVGAALTTATIIPWGVWLQALTVGIGAGSLVASVYYVDGDLSALPSDAGVATVISFGLSLVAAREITNYRLAHRRELLDRKRAERTVRRLAARLEQRVVERTRALERAHEAVRQHQADLAHVLRLHTMGEMTSALAHEINQPLCAITNYAQGAVQRLRSGSTDLPALQQVCEQIAHEGLRAADILRSIRALIRRDSAISDDIDVNALAADALRVMEPQARAHGVTVRLERGADLPSIHADGTQIEQVMLNLMLNGVQAAALARVPPREVVVATAVDRGHVQVTVRDTGQGFAPSIRERLFTPFVTTKEHGLGLGLVISRSIVESYGGRLWATSREVDGTVFHFSLPTDGTPLHLAATAPQRALSD